MDRKRALILAAELATHRYWRVEDVFMVHESEPDKWSIRLVHRRNEAEVVYVCSDERLVEMASVLTEFGIKYDPANRYGVLQAELPFI